MFTFGVMQQGITDFGIKEVYIRNYLQKYWMTELYVSQVRNV